MPKSQCRQNGPAPRIKSRAGLDAPRGHGGFTLIELMLAVAIAAIVLMLAVPSIVSVFKDDKLSETYNNFDQFVQKIRTRSVVDQKDLILVWDKEGIEVVAADPEEGGTAAEPERYDGATGALTLERPAAMAKNPPAEWIFWHSGICEPANITYKGPEGAWTAQYDPLTGHGTLVAKNLP